MDDRLVPYWEAWSLLSADRPLSLAGVAFIPVQAILDFAIRVEGVTGAEDLKDFIRLVRTVDQEFIRIKNELAQKDQGSGDRTISSHQREEGQGGGG